VIVERREEGDSQTAVRHGVQETMASGSNKEIQPHGVPAKIGPYSPKSYEHYGARHDSGKKKRVRESAVAPEVTIADAESEAKDVNIGNYRAERPHDPNPFWRAWAVEAGTYAEGCHRM
jgi:hypothetical protein